VPTVNENRMHWSNRDSWRDEGEDWSREWGGSQAQWEFSILPRIRAFLPTNTILEIGPGFGRWTQYLKDFARNLILIDLSDMCIQECKERFAQWPHISYHVNDGTSLEIVQDESIDLVFSFDSLVHAEDEVIRAYISQIAKKLRPNGVGFIHHSNLGEYKRYYSVYGLSGFVKVLTGYIFPSLRIMNLPPHRAFLQMLMRIGLIEYDGWRAISMTAEKFRNYANDVGLHCISQDITNLHLGSKRLIDCVSTFTPKKSTWDRETIVVRIKRESIKRLG
jgi:SAM-dependent methyltransferase